MVRSDAMMCRGIRGATTVEQNSGEDILAATRELLEEMLTRNEVLPDDIAFIYFTTTADLNAEFPAVAAREMGLWDTPLLCGHEMNVPGSLPRCLRILVLVNTERRADEIVHVYTKGAQGLRAVKTIGKGEQQ